MKRRTWFIEHFFKFGSGMVVVGLTGWAASLAVLSYQCFIASDFTGPTHAVQVGLFASGALMLCGLLTLAWTMFFDDISEER